MASVVMPDVRKAHGALNDPTTVMTTDFSEVPHTRHDLNPFKSYVNDVIELIEDGLLSHEHICRILKQLIATSDYSQVQLLWTALQPILHRDVMFTSQNRDDDTIIAPISTALSRGIRTHLTETRNITRYHRVQSAYLTNEEEVLRQNRLPPITTGRGNQLSDRPGVSIVKKKTHFPTLKKSISDNRRRQRVQANQKTQQNDKQSHRRAMKIQLLGERKTFEINQKLDNLFTWYEKWTNPERATFFQKILPRIETKQLYFLSTYLSVRRHCDIISKLPKNLSLKILSFLSAKDLAVASTVSRKWNRRSLSNELWEEKCDEVRSEIATPSVSSRVGDYYDVYRTNHIRRRNWSRARCSHVHLCGHESKVLAVTFNSKIVVSGGADATVRVWNLRSENLAQVLTGHTKGVWSVAIFTDVLVLSGSYDHTIKVWNIQGGECLRTLFGHSGAIWSLACKRHLVATGSHDKLIKVWDMRHCVLQHTFKGHGSAIFTVDLSDDLSTLFSGSADHSVRIWDIFGRKCLKVIWASNSSPVMSVNYHNGYLAYAAHNVITVYDVDQSEPLKSYRRHKCRVETVKINVKVKHGERIVSVLSAGRDGMVKHWKLGERKENTKTMVVHRDCQVNCIAFDKKRLVAAMYDNNICLCDFSIIDQVPNTQ